MAATQSEDVLFISIITLGEYDKAIYNLPNDHPDRSRYIAARDALEVRFQGRILSIDDSIVCQWGKISGEVKRLTGHPPSVIDSFLAASAIENDLFLVTRNIKDVKHSGAAIFNPWSDDASDFIITKKRESI